jgi:hypothetical protein
MIRSALILSATLLAAVCFACVLPPPAPGAVHGLTTTACSSANTPAENAAAFANKAANGYLTSPAAIYPGAPLPVSSALPQPGSGTPDYSQGLMNAFLAASTAFRKPNTPNGRIVALSTGLWNEASYSSYETDLTRSLLPSNVVVNYSNASYCSSPTVCNSIDTPTIALLAALAHEVGHIAWYFQVPSSSPTSFCGGNFFTGWVASTVTPPPQWRDLLSAAARDQIRSNGNGKWPYVHQPHSPQIDSIDHPGPGDQAAGKSVYALLYNGTPPSYPQPWASFFAALSPDEDFVETYKFAVLTTAAVPLNSVAIAVQGYGTANIAQDYSAGNRPDLTTKVGCVSISF